MVRKKTRNTSQREGLNRRTETGTQPNQSGSGSWGVGGAGKFSNSCFDFGLFGPLLLHGGFGAVGVLSLCNGDLQREQNSRDQTLQASPIRGNEHIPACFGSPRTG